MGKFPLLGKGRGSSSRTHYRRIKKAVDVHMRNVKLTSPPTDNIVKHVRSSKRPRSTMACNYSVREVIPTSIRTSTTIRCENEINEMSLSNATHIPVTTVTSSENRRLIQQDTGSEGSLESVSGSASVCEPVYPDGPIDRVPVSALQSSSTSVPPLVQPSCSFRSFLAEWAIGNNISHSALNQLLQGFNKFGNTFGLPQDARTLLKTPRNVEIRAMGSGEYVNFGLKHCLLKKVEQLEEYELKCLTLNFNIDGIPLFKSSRTEFWPILCSIQEADDKGMLPFPVAVFCGDTKPPIKEFFVDFIHDLADLLQNGLVFKENHVYPVKLRAFIADAPAKAYMRCVKLHSGYSGCDKCTTMGVYYGRVTFPEIDADLRTDESFVAYEDTEFHNDKTPFDVLNVGLISSFPIDYMHLVCLGVMKRLLQCWLRGIKHVKITSARISKAFQSVINCFLINSKKRWPSDFARQPRTLNDMDRWKATELRQFLLYLAPVALKGLLADDVYKHFLLLHCAINILVGERYKELNDLADQLLRTFVSHSAQYYGNEFIVYNVHMLIHLSKDALRCGPLDTFSAFKYENQLGIMKRELRSKSKPLQQLCKRLGEQEHIIQSNTNSNNVPNSFFPTQIHIDGPTAGLQGIQYSKLTGPFFELSTHPRNRNVILKDNSVFQVENFIVPDVGKQDVYLVGFKFTKYTDFYTYPIKSSVLDVFLVEKLEKELSVIPVKQLKKKAVLLPYKHGYCTVETHTKNGLELFAVPEAWLYKDGGRQMVKFPLYLNTKRCETAAQMKELPTDRWKTYAATVVNSNLTYSDAKERAAQLSDGNETDRKPKKKTCIGKKLFPNSNRTLPTFSSVKQTGKLYPKGYKTGKGLPSLSKKKNSVFQYKNSETNRPRPTQPQTTTSITNGQTAPTPPHMPFAQGIPTTESRDNSDFTVPVSNTLHVLERPDHWQNYSLPQEASPSVNNSFHSSQHLPHSFISNTFSSSLQDSSMSFNTFNSSQHPAPSHTFSSSPQPQPSNSNYVFNSSLQYTPPAPVSSTRTAPQHTHPAPVSSTRTAPQHTPPAFNSSPTFTLTHNLPNPQIDYNDMQEDGTGRFPETTNAYPELHSRHCACDDGFQRKVFEYMEFMRRQILYLTQAVAPNLDINMISNFKHQLPLHLEAHVMDLDEHTANMDNLTLMCKSVGLVGGSDVKECVRRVMTQLFHLDLAKKVNWAGSSKLALKNFINIRRTIKGAVRSNQQFAKATDSEIEEAIKKWLRGSADRGGGWRARKVFRQEQHNGNNSGNNA